jgi:hypothetical protein
MNIEATDKANLLLKLYNALECFKKENNMNFIFHQIKRHTWPINRFGGRI